MQALEIIGTLVGLLYLYFEYRASIWLWAASIVMPAIYIFVYHHAGFYADMGINVYYLFASGYGWAMWMRRTHRKRRSSGQLQGANGRERKDGSGRSGAESIEASSPMAVHRAAPDGTDLPAQGLERPSDLGCSAASIQTLEKDASAAAETRPITHIPPRRWLPLAGVFLLAFALIAHVLIRYTDSTVPYGDSFTTAMSIVGMWMLAQKYVEQWLVWIAVDVVCTGLYIYKGLYPTAALYALYTIIAVFGYFKWLHMIQKNAHV